MGLQNVVPDTEAIIRANFQSRCVLAGHIAQADGTLGLVKGEEMADTIRKMSGHQLRILIEPFRRLRIQPAASQASNVTNISRILQ